MEAMDNCQIQYHLRQKIQCLKDTEAKWQSEEDSRKRLEKTFLRSEKDNFRFMNIYHDQVTPFEDNADGGDELQHAQWNYLEEVVNQENLSCQDILRFNSLYREREEYLHEQKNLWKQKLSWYQGRANILGIQTGLRHELLKEQKTNTADLSFSEPMLAKLSTEKTIQNEESTDRNPEKLVRKNIQLQEEHTILSSKVSELTSTVRKLQQENERSKRATKAMENTYKTVVEKEQEMKKVIRELEEERDQLGSIADTYEEELTEKEERLTMAYRCNRDLVKKVETLEEELLKKEQLLKISCETIVGLNNNRETLDVDQAKFMETDKKGEKAPHCETTPQTACDNCQAVEQIMKEKEDLNQELHNNISDLEIEQCTLKSKLQHLVRETNKIISKYETEKASCIGKIQKMEQKVEDLEKLCAATWDKVFQKYIKSTLDSNKQHFNGVQERGEGLESRKEQVDLQITEMNSKVTFYEKSKMQPFTYSEQLFKSANNELAQRQKKLIEENEKFNFLLPKRLMEI